MGLEGWSDFNVATAGATAALAGLIIVAMSVNIKEAIQAETIPSRVAAAIAGLVLALVASLAALAPAQPVWALGLELLVPTLAAGTLQWRASGHIMAETTAPPGWRLPKVALGWLPIAAYLVASVTLMAGAPWGYGFAAAGGILAIISSVLLAWVVLVEILR
ncbi:hypothetical protein E6C70_13880 [Glaciibacter flavus]|uniref:Uncharacterized protein n=1 Tax=Orlajensenia flava TaxID=2565934 RepID=A0A4S4FND7_9MICO|nr:hypothetical protein [Glaciibacter flavus]THG31372.1 hypothetical protein E6C70_13880 [Glaciibacter flavus]